MPDFLGCFCIWLSAWFCSVPRFFLFRLPRISLELPVEDSPSRFWMVGFGCIRRSPPPPAIMATPSEMFRYTSLPAEIRDFIMEHALVPGDVYPCSKPPPAKTSHKLLRTVFRVKIGGVDHHVAARRPPGFGLLVTCRRAYEDGHGMFYSRNTFHLPAGSAADAAAWSDGLLPHQRSLIKSACLDLSLADITPEVLNEMEKRWLWDLPLKSRQDERRMVFEVVYLLCWRYWQEKIRFLQRWEALGTVDVRTGSETFSFGAEGFRALDAKEEKEILDLAREKVKAELEGMVEEMGWKAVRKLFMTRAVASGV